MEIAKNLVELETTIQRACQASERLRSEVQILAVTKMQSIVKIEEAYQCGIRHFGENYVQELEKKKSALSHLKDVTWHLIGHLQTNKVKQVLGLATYFHALDSERLLKEIEKRNNSSPWKVFIEVNIDNDPNKHGVQVQDLWSLAEKANSSKAIQLIGLMCVPEDHGDTKKTRDSFLRLRTLAQDLSRKLNAELELSMGMSEDFTLAVEAGSHWVRIGRKLFGERSRL